MKRTITIIQANGTTTLLTVSPNQELKIGKIGNGNDIEYDDSFVSRKHAIIKLFNGKLTIVDRGSKNGTYINGKEITPQTPFSLQNNDVIKFAEKGSQIKVSQNVEKPPRRNDRKYQLRDIERLLNTQNEVIIGRASSCDIVLNEVMVSRNHTSIRKNGNSYIVKDLDSKNGTYVNGNRIKEKEIRGHDEIRITATKFKINGEITNIRGSEYAIEAEMVAKIYPNGRGLHPLSLKVRRGSFVALMGPSGCGKSTLLKALNGDNPATDGIVKIDQLELNKEHFDYIKSTVGYVPQDDIVHKDLTVQQTLYYAAKLRMPDGMSKREIDNRIDEVLNDLNITPKIRQNKIKALSGGQRKRISIAVELLNNPSILFLDEPTSPLDPETIGSFLESIQELIKKNKTTVIMVTHKPSDLDYVDEVIFLSSGGWHAFTGSQDELLSYFNTKKIIGIYSELKEEKRGQKWYNRLYQNGPVSTFRKKNVDTTAPRMTKNLLGQYWWLSVRYANIKVNDLSNLGILLAQSLVIAGLVRFTYDSLQLGVLFLMSISAIWFGVNNAAREIVSESAIYKRERMVNLNIFTYLFSKLSILTVIAIVQVLIFVSVIYLGYDGDDVYMYSYKAHFLFMGYIAFSATLFGLFLSTLFKTTEKVLSMVPLALIPQIILAGVVASIDSNAKELLSYFSLGRWGTEGLSYIQDYKGLEVTEVADSSNVQEGVVYLKPSTENIGEMEEASSSAIDLLKFYKETESFTPLALFQDGNYWIPITILNVAMFVSLFFLLKRKDSLK